MCDAAWQAATSAGGEAAAGGGGGGAGGAAGGSSPAVEGRRCLADYNPLEREEYEEVHPSSDL